MRDAYFRWLALLTGMAAVAALLVFFISPTVPREEPESEAESAALEADGPDAGPTTFHMPGGGMRVYFTNARVVETPTARIFQCPGGAILVGPPQARIEDICGQVRP